MLTMGHNQQITQNIHANGTLFNNLSNNLETNRDNIITAIYQTELHQQAQTFLNNNGNFDVDSINNNSISHNRIISHRQENNVV